MTPVSAKRRTAAQARRARAPAARRPLRRRQLGRPPGRQHPGHRRGRRPDVQPRRQLKRRVETRQPLRSSSTASRRRARSSMTSDFAPTGPMVRWSHNTARCLAASVLSRPHRPPQRCRQPAGRPVRRPAGLATPQPSSAKTLLPPHSRSTEVTPRAASSATSGFATMVLTGKWFKSFARWPAASASRLRSRRPPPTLRRPTHRPARQPAHPRPSFRPMRFLP